jgi:hypothetical protein
MKRNLVTFLSIAIVSLASVSLVFGQSYDFSGSTTFGEGTSGNTVVGTSNNGTYSTVSFAVPEGMTLADLDTLSTDYFTEDGCSGGSPRFTVITDEGGLYDFWWNCTAGVAANTGNLAAGNVDVRGSHAFQYQASFADVQAQFGSETIQSINLIVDGSWAFPDGSQEVVFDNVNVDGTVYNFESPGSMNHCKNGGWRMFTDGNGNALYRNQGQCVSFFASGGKSGGKKG